MATKLAIALLRSEAIDGINSSASRIGELLSVAPPGIPMVGHDADLLQARQLEAIAAYLQGLGDVLATSQTTKTSKPPRTRVKSGRKL